MPSEAADLSRRLAREAEAVCRHYLSNGRRRGRYWIVGDVANTPGRSLFVRLTGPQYGQGAAGHWTDAATAEHGDLLDLIRLSLGLKNLPLAMDEARTFLALPRPERLTTYPLKPAPTGSPDAARRLFEAGRPIFGTVAEAYLRARGITGSLNWSALRYHPWVYYRESEDAPREVWPALLAAVTDLEGRITGLLRTWLDPQSRAKAPIANPRRALGHLLGNGVRFGIATDVLATGEGIETVLALKSVLPRLPMVAALSANHLAMLEFGPLLRRLYVARDNDAAGLHAARQLHERGSAAGVEVHDLVPRLKDFNVDLCRLGPAPMLPHIAGQLVSSDLVRFAEGEHRVDLHWSA
jgi:hypothetical protein